MLCDFSCGNLLRLSGKADEYWKNIKYFKNEF